MGTVSISLLFLCFSVSSETHSHSLTVVTKKRKCQQQTEKCHVVTAVTGMINHPHSLLSPLLQLLILLVPAITMVVVEEKKEGGPVSPLFP